MYTPSKPMIWVSDILLNTEEDSEALKCVLVQAVSIMAAATATKNIIERAYPDTDYFIHAIGICANQEDTSELGKILPDPIGWIEEDLGSWKWE